MKNSYKIKQILVDLAADDKIPSDMNQLDTSLFEEFDNMKETEEFDNMKETVGGFQRGDIQGVLDGMEITLSEEKFDALFEYLRNNHDASTGMTWDSIEISVGLFLQN